MALDRLPHLFLLIRFLCLCSMFFALVIRFVWQTKLATPWSTFCRTNTLTDSLTSISSVISSETWCLSTQTSTSVTRTTEVVPRSLNAETQSAVSTVNAKWDTVDRPALVKTICFLSSFVV